MFLSPKLQLLIIIIPHFTQILVQLRCIFFINMCYSSTLHGFVIFYFAYFFISLKYLFLNGAIRNKNLYMVQTKSFAIDNSYIYIDTLFFIVCHEM